MKLKLLAAAAAMSISVPAVAMPVQTFLAKAEALKAKGPIALFSRDYKLLTNAIKGDAAALRGEREAARAARRTPAYCPPGPIQMGSTEVVQVMQAVPPAQRGQADTRDVLRAYFARRFPCRS